MILPKSFYCTSTKLLARKLLGTFLVHYSKQGRTVGRIVETEAYLFKNDPACHAHRGITKRNKVMFGPPGRSYVYLIYGMYYCFNVVSGNEGRGEAVLIRGLEPVEGVALMQMRRKVTEHKMLCNGPGKLMQAMGMGKYENDIILYGNNSVRILARGSYKKKFPVRFPIQVTTRIGISAGKELPLRFYIRNSDCVSKY
jgi:DNA-3-methyladenine glycosylase